MLATVFFKVSEPSPKVRLRVPCGTGASSLHAGAEPDATALASWDAPEMTALSAAVVTNISS